MTVYSKKYYIATFFSPGWGVYMKNIIPATLDPGLNKRDPA